MGYFRAEPKIESGFTLIELMIVVAIVGILAAIGVSEYLDMAPKAQVAAALAEITPAKNMIEIKISEGVSAADAASLSETSANALANLGIPSTSSLRCSTYTPVVGTDATGSISCTITGAWAIEGKTLTWTRTADGLWSCTTDVDEKYRPKGCNAA
jgi:type IV pilus assembly protein PilA